MNLNTNSQLLNMSISTGAYGSQKVVDNEPTSPFHQRKAFNIPDNSNFAKSFSSNIYNSQNSDNKSLQTMQNGRMSPVTSVYPASSFYKPMASLYQPQIQSQSPKQYENVLSPSYQPSNKLTVVEKKEEPVEVKRTRGRPRKSRKSSPKDSITLLSPSPSTLTSHVASLSPSSSSSTASTSTTSTTNNNNNYRNNNNNAFEPITKPTQKPKSNSKSSSKSKKKKATSNTIENDKRKQSRIIYPDLDISSIFNDSDYYDYSFMIFSLKDKMLESARNIKFLKENDSNNYSYNEIFENGELISLNDDRFLLPSEVIKDIKFPKRKLEFVLISDNESDDEENSNYKHVEKKIKIEENIKVKVEKEIVENNRRNEVVDDSNNNNGSIENKNYNIPEIKSDINNFVQKAPVTPFYTYYEKFLEDFKNGKLKSV